MNLRTTMTNGPWPHRFLLFLYNILIQYWRFYEVFFVWFFFTCFYLLVFTVTSYGWVIQIDLPFCGSFWRVLIPDLLLYVHAGQH